MQTQYLAVREPSGVAMPKTLGKESLDARVRVASRALRAPAQRLNGHISGPTLNAWGFRERIDHA